MKPEDTISYVAIAVIAVSLFFIGTELTGNALVDTGLVNVTIDTSASIVFETALIDFGNGTVTPGQTAIISSDGTDTAWSGSTSGMSGLILENNGNTNVSFTLMSNKSAVDFLGGTAPQFELLVSDNESGSCGSTANFTSYEAATVDPTERLACGNLGYQETQDSVEIDARLTFNDDAGGAKTVGVTATATTTLY